MRKIDIIGNIVSGTIIGIFFIVVVSLSLKRCEKKSVIKPIDAWENKQIIQDSSIAKSPLERPRVITNGNSTLTDHGYTVEPDEIFITIAKLEKEMKRLRRIEAEHNAENCCTDEWVIGKHTFKEILESDSLIIKLDSLK